MHSSYPYRFGKRLPGAEVQERHEGILIDDVPKSPNIYRSSDGRWTPVDLSNDSTPMQAKYLKWRTSLTMNFALQMDFVECNVTNCVNLTWISE